MPDRPNVVFVLCDQLRAEAVGCLGNDQVATPAIDRLADEGVLCPRTYTPNPVCSPARASLQTGRYPHANGVPGNKLRLPTDGPSLAGVLRDAGYRTGYVGKWHLDGEPAPGYIPPGPRRQGYEYWEGFNRGHRHLKGHPTFDADGEVRWETGYQPAVQTDHAVP
jgi:arylsulfatase A-like enzyme